MERLLTTTQDILLIPLHTRLPFGCIALLLTTVDCLARHDLLQSLGLYMSEMFNDSRCRIYLKRSEGNEQNCAGASS